MADLLITIDTEIRPPVGVSASAAPDIDSGVWGITAGREYGVRFQLEAFRATGIKAVFFVEALCSKVIGTEILARVIEPILTDGHEVQLHLHSEWLSCMENPPVPYHGRNNMKDLTEAEQFILIEVGLDALTKAGASGICAFRAGNYGADNATLRALRRAGLHYDTSYNVPYLGRQCAIKVDGLLVAPREIEGMVEIPVTHYEDFPGHARHLQLGACSTAEIMAVLSDAASLNLPICTLVSHSFELLNARHTRSNPVLVRRFHRLCALLSEHRASIRTIGFSEIPSGSLPDARTERKDPNKPTHLRSHVGRTVWRAMEQAVGRLYD